MGSILFPRAHTLKIYGNDVSMDANNHHIVESLLDLEQNGAWEPNSNSDGCEVWLAEVKGKSLYAVRGRTRIKRKPLWFVIRAQLNLKIIIGEIIFNLFNF